MVVFFRIVSRIHLLTVGITIGGGGRDEGWDKTAPGASNKLSYLFRQIATIWVSGLILPFRSLTSHLAHTGLHALVHATYSMGFIAIVRRVWHMRWCRSIRTPPINSMFGLHNAYVSSRECSTDSSRSL